MTYTSVRNGQEEKAFEGMRPERRLFEISSDCRLVSPCRLGNSPVKALFDKSLCKERRELGGCGSGVGTKMGTKQDVHFFEGFQLRKLGQGSRELPTREFAERSMSIHGQYTR